MGGLYKTKYTQFGNIESAFCANGALEDVIENAVVEELIEQIVKEKMASWLDGSSEQDEELVTKERIESEIEQIQFDEQSHYKVNAVEEARKALKAEQIRVSEMLSVITEAIKEARDNLKTLAETQIVAQEGVPGNDGKFLSALYRGDHTAEGLLCTFSGAYYADVPGDNHKKELTKGLSGIAQNAANAVVMREYLKTPENAEHLARRLVHLSPECHQSANREKLSRLKEHDTFCAAMVKELVSPQKNSTANTGLANDIVDEHRTLTGLVAGGLFGKRTNLREKIDEAKRTQWSKHSEMQVVSAEKVEQRGWLEWLKDIFAAPVAMKAASFFGASYVPVVKAELIEEELRVKIPI